ncbi:hypothetical protein FJK98_15605 [Micromonospora sp. HM134]|uniref:hypothetical protein n=1 Tax=unclassified Micromonospora TaxID=2617518 RepID=UPI0011987F16|nr:MULTISPECIES: hypothetical protein [unclassified Micromonospora]QDY08404.1 hypothetical protein FJK98_15605 [Micromonospora sp. HM134]
MPQVTENEDGTTTFSINSAELRRLRDLVVDRVPELKRALELAESPEVRTTLRFVRSVLR